VNFDTEKSNLYTRSKEFNDAALTSTDLEDYIYIMLLDDNGDIVSEPYIASENSLLVTDGGYEITLSTSDTGSDLNSSGTAVTRNNDLSKFTQNSIVLVDYYVKRDSGAY